MAIVQWVNLEKDSDYLDDADIPSLDRCGALEVKSGFTKDNIPLSYKVKVSSASKDNVEYTDAEKGRNDNFKLMKGATDLAAEAEVLMSDVIRLPAAGGNKYKLEAIDANGNDVESQEVEAKRKLYYQYMHMEDTNGKVKAVPLTQLEKHCLKNYMVLTKAGANKKIKFRKNINMSANTRSNYRHFADDAKVEYDLKSAQKKVGCVTVLSNYISRYKKKSVSLSYTIGASKNTTVSIKHSSSNVMSSISSSISPSIVSLKIFSGSEFLWYGLNDDDDAGKVWFIDGAISFTPNSSNNIPGALAGHSIPIDRADVNIGGTSKNTYGGYRTIDITVGVDLQAMLEQIGGTIKFILDINKVSGFAGGFSWGGNGFDLTTCCTKSWFKDVAATSSDVIWNHEIGHRVGMVAHGDKTNASHPDPKLPDAPPNLYGERSGINDNGHQGPHCAKGVSYSPPVPPSKKGTWSGSPGCVLFGATSNGGVSSPLDYCSDCTPIVRKLDLSFS